MILVGDRRQHRSVTAGEPLKLLEESAGLKVAEVTEILRQQGDYKKAAQALSEGRAEEAFQELDKLGWIKQVEDSDRYQQLAAAYLSAVREKKRNGQSKVGAGRIADARRSGPDHRGHPRRAEGAGKARQGTHRRGLGARPPDRRRKSRSHRCTSQATWFSSTRTRRATRRDRG